MNDQNTPNEMPDDSLFADRLRDAFAAEEATIESRRREGVLPQRRAAAPIWTRPIFALSAVAILMIGGFFTLGALGGGDTPSETVEIASAPSPTPMPVVSPVPAPTGTEGTSPEVTVQATVSATPSPTPLPEDATQTPVQVPAQLPGDLGCTTFGVDQQILRVSNVTVDDPDGGLVVHTDAGVNTPVRGVLPHHATVRATGPCEQLDSGAIWREVDNGNSLVGWVNAAFLSLDPAYAINWGETAVPYQVFFSDDNNLDQFDATKPVTRWFVTDNASVDLLQALTDGPSELEREAGLAGAYEGGIFCDQEFPAPAEQMGSDVVVTICPQGSAGVGQDARRLVTVRDTFLNLPGVEHVAVIDGTSGLCLGDLSGNPGQPCRDGDSTQRTTCDTGLQVPEVGTLELAGSDSAEMDHVQDVEIESLDECTIVTLVMGKDLIATGQSNRADVVRSGVTVERLGDETIVSFPSWFTPERLGEFTSTAGWSEDFDAGLGGFILFADGATGDRTIDGRDYVLITNGSEEPVHVSTLPNPARLIITVPKSDTPQPIAGLFGTAAGASYTGFYIEPLVETTDGVAVKGFGRGFEGIALVSVIDADLNPVEFFVGGESAVPDSKAFLTGGADGWGSFGFTIGGLAPGEYRAVLDPCDQCDPNIGQELPNFFFTVN